jgi:hypothetical protein
MEQKLTPSRKVYKCVSDIVEINRDAVRFCSQEFEMRIAGPTGRKLSYEILNKT